MGGGAGSENLCWKDAVRAAALFAVDPAGIGGIAVRAMPGPARERWLTLLREFLGPELPLRAVPLTVSDDRLLGGLDIPATLQAGRPVAIRGILAEADRGVVLLRMAERIALSTAAHIVAALDLGEVVAERDGMTLRQPARFGIVALDESIATDESPPTALLDRLAFHIDLSEIRLRDIVGPVFSHDLSAARELLPCVAASEEVIRAFCATAMAVGISSLRVPMLSLRAARISAALDGRRFVSELDAALAARLVIAPRVGVLSEPAENPAEDRRAAMTVARKNLPNPQALKLRKMRIGSCLNRKQSRKSSWRRHAPRYRPGCSRSSRRRTVARQHAGRGGPGRFGLHCIAVAPPVSAKVDWAAERASI